MRSDYAIMGLVTPAEARRHQGDAQLIAEPLGNQEESVVSNWGLAPVMAVLLVGCVGSSRTSPEFAGSRYRTAFIEPFENDRFKLQDLAAFEVARTGLKQVKSESEADLIIHWRYTHALFDTNASVHAEDRGGNVVYTSESHNYGFGTALNPHGTTEGRIKSAFAGLRRALSRR